jgi:alanine racemase
MTLQARLISVREVAAGASIGYNSQFICPNAMRVGTVSIGYADGYPSNTPNGAPVMICGERAQTIGRVSMDMLAIDLTAIPAAQVGDVVTLWGDDVSLDEVAAHTGILSYNLTCSITARVPFVYK